MDGFKHFQQSFQHVESAVESIENQRRVYSREHWIKESGEINRNKLQAIPQNSKQGGGACFTLAVSVSNICGIVSKR